MVASSSSAVWRILSKCSRVRSDGASGGMPLPEKGRERVGRSSQSRSTSSFAFVVMACIDSAVVRCRWLLLAER